MKIFQKSILISLLFFVFLLNGQQTSGSLKPNKNLINFQQQRAKLYDFVIDFKKFAQLLVEVENHEQSLVLEIFKGKVLLCKGQISKEDSQEVVCALSRNDLLQFCDEQDICFFDLKISRSLEDQLASDSLNDTHLDINMHHILFSEDCAQDKFLSEQKSYEKCSFLSNTRNQISLYTYYFELKQGQKAVVNIKRFQTTNLQLKTFFDFVQEGGISIQKRIYPFLDSEDFDFFLYDNPKGNSSLQVVETQILECFFPSQDCLVTLSVYQKVKHLEEKNNIDQHEIQFVLENSWQQLKEDTPYTQKTQNPLLINNLFISNPSTISAINLQEIEGKTQFQVCSYQGFLQTQCLEPNYLSQQILGQWISNSENLIISYIEKSKINFTWQQKLQEATEQKPFKFQFFTQFLFTFKPSDPKIQHYSLKTNKQKINPDLEDEKIILQVQVCLLEYFPNCEPKPKNENNSNKTSKILLNTQEFIIQNNDSLLNLPTVSNKQFFILNYKRIQNYDPNLSFEVQNEFISIPDDNGLSGGAIAGIVIGCFAFVIIIGLGIWYWKKKHNSGSTDQESNASESLIK